jgi:hypothetical protein
MRRFVKLHKKSHDAAHNEGGEETEPYPAACVYHPAET